MIKKNAFKCGGDMSKIEKMSEKEMRMKMFGGPEDTAMMMDTQVTQAAADPWQLIPIDLPETTVRPEVRSLEREIQAKREQTTLAMLVFKRFLPDSASEPDLNSDSTSEFKTKLIPLEDTNDSSINHPSHPNHKPLSPVQGASSNLSINSGDSVPSERSPPPPPPPHQTSEQVKSSSIDHILNISAKILPTATAAQSLKTILDAIKHTLPSTTANNNSNNDNKSDLSPEYNQKDYEEGLFFFLIF